MKYRNNGPTQEYTEKESQNFLLLESVVKSTSFSLKRNSEYLKKKRGRLS